MKKKILKIFTVTMLISSICILTSCSSKYNKSIDLKGNNNFWQASLNINLKYDSELIIRPARNDFQIPSVINVDIVVNNKHVYTDELKYVPDSNKNLLGKYSITLNSSNYFKKDTNYVNIIIGFNNESSSLLLNQDPETK